MGIHPEYDRNISAMKNPQPTPHQRPSTDLNNLRRLNSGIKGGTAKKLNRSNMKVMFFRLCSFLSLFLLGNTGILAQSINLQWEPREDLNILLPSSVGVYETSGKLSDGAPVRAVYATIDLRDKNLKLRALGSNNFRQTTKETSDQNDGILAINGGYFSGNTSVSLLVSDGEILSPGLSHTHKKGGFGLIEGKPEIFWTQSESATSPPLVYNTPTSKTGGQSLKANQAVGGGPVLVKNGEIHVTSEEEGFGGSHILRHPRTAIGYRDEHTLVMMVVDGRQETSAGVTLPELAQMMYDVGAVEALNLDGGGSSAMVAAEEVVNIPADIPGGNRNSLRRNASALVLSERIPSEGNEVYYFDTDSQYYTEEGLWKTSNLVNYYGESPSRTSSADQLHNKAVYTFDSIPRKNYQLGAWWTVSGENSDRIAYILHHGHSSDTIFVDQQTLHNSGKWNIIGEFNLGSNDSLEIMGAGKQGKMKIDAIRLVAEKNTPELPVRGDLRIAVISDLNSGLGAADYEWQVDSIIRRIPRLWRPDMVISGGDMVAGMGISDTAHLRKMWAGFDKHIASPLKKQNIPFAFTLGNHDGPRSYPVEQKIAAEYWNKPENDPGLEFVDREFFPNYYSFVKDDFFFVSWEASSSEITQANLEWMKQQFEKPEAMNAKMRFVVGHMPLYSVAQERDSKGNVLQNPEKLQQLLEDFNVHTYISGHQHAFFPGKKGDLELLNTGAAGSGPRGWLTQETKPVNTITIMDIFKEEDSISYHTYKIKEKKAGDMALFNEKGLPSSIFGLNGFIVRRDISLVTKASGAFSAINASENSEETGKGKVTAEISGNKLFISGEFSQLKGNLVQEDPVALFRGRNTEEGEIQSVLKVRPKSKTAGKLSGTVKADKDLAELLAIGALYVSIKTEAGEIRTQLTPVNNRSPEEPEIISHKARNIYAVRDLEALYEIEWTAANDLDGDFISYTYQLSSDRNFDNIVFQEKTGRTPGLKRTEKDWFQLLEAAPVGNPVTFYHRVAASDGKNIVYTPGRQFQLMKTNEPLDDFIEVPAPEYVFSGKIENAPGAGYGAEWDHNGKLWLADYGGSLIVKLPNGTDAPFSPLKAVEIAGKTYDLSPVNGIGIDSDGHVLVGRNRHLIKIDATTGKGIAVWEAPEGQRAITSPRANDSGEIYAMSLFGDDLNYVLKQNAQIPSTFDLVRTLELKNRILSRTFDMSPNGKTLYFPDPGSPMIQKYTSKDGISYTKEKEITSTSSGSSAIQVVNGNSIYVAARASGIAPSTFHFRNEEEQKMWTMELPEVNGAEPRGIGVSPDGKTLIFCSWDKGGGYFQFVLKE